MVFIVILVTLKIECVGLHAKNRPAISPYCPYPTIINKNNYLSVILHFFLFMLLRELISVGIIKLNKIVFLSWDGVCHWSLSARSHVSHVVKLNCVCCPVNLFVGLNLILIVCWLCFKMNAFNLLALSVLNKGLIVKTLSVLGSSFLTFVKIWCV